MQNDSCTDLLPILDTVEDNNINLNYQNFTIELIHDKVADFYQQNCTVVLKQVSYFDKDITMLIWGKTCPHCLVFPHPLRYLIFSLQTTSNLMEMYGVYSNFSDIVSILQDKVVTAFPATNETSECTAVQLSQRSIESTVDSCTNTSSILSTIIKSIGKFGN